MAKIHRKHPTGSATDRFEAATWFSGVQTALYQPNTNPIPTVLNIQIDATVTPESLTKPSWKAEIAIAREGNKTARNPDQLRLLGNTRIAARGIMPSVPFSCLPTSITRKTIFNNELNYPDSKQNQNAAWPVSINGHDCHVLIQQGRGNWITFDKSDA